MAESDLLSCVFRIVRSRIFWFLAGRLIAMSNLRYVMLLLFVSGAIMGCGGGGYTYSPPPPPAPGSTEEVDPNAGVSVDPSMMQQGM